MKIHDTAHRLRLILATTATTLGLPLAVLTSPSRDRELVEARGIGIYLSREITGASWSRIGKIYGGRHYTTTLYAYQSTLQRIESDPELAQLVEGIRDSVLHSATLKVSRIGALEERVAELEAFIDRLAVREGVVYLRGTGNATQTAGRAAIGTLADDGRAA